MGMSRTKPSTLALMAVQRQTAASRSARPPRRLQHGWAGTLPASPLMSPSTLAHTPNLSVLTGHLLYDGVVGAGGGGDGTTGGDGVGHLPQAQPQALAAVKKRRLSAKMRRTLDAMARVLPNLVDKCILVQTRAVACVRWEGLGRGVGGIYRRTHKS
jgi:hypothetical protein